MRLIAVDIGNTATKVLIQPLDQSSTSDAAFDFFHHRDSKYLEACQLPAADLLWVVSSVNHSQRDRFQQWVSTHRPQDHVHCVSLTDFEFPINVDVPEQVGLDRLLAAAGTLAIRLSSNRSTIIIDAGTAVTVDMLDEAGTFQGGFIFPGADASYRQLNEQASALPNLDYASRITRLHEIEASSVPVESLGKNTFDAILKGVYSASFHGIAGATHSLMKNNSFDVLTTGRGIKELALAQSILGFSHAGFPAAWTHHRSLVLTGIFQVGRRALDRFYD